MTRIKRDKKYKTEFMGIRCTNEQFNRIKTKSLLYTDGNLSEYVLYAALNFNVSDKDLENKPSKPSKLNEGN